MSAIEAAQALIFHGLQRENATLLGAGVSALAAVASDQQDFMVLLQQCARGDELASLVKLARTLIKKFPKRGRVIDWTGALHLVTRQVSQQRFRAQVAELDLAATGPTRAEARSAVLKGVSASLERLWTSFSGHKLAPEVEIELIKVEAIVEASSKGT